MSGQVSKWHMASLNLTIFFVKKVERNIQKYYITRLTNTYIFLNTYVNPSSTVEVPQFPSMQKIYML